MRINKSVDIVNIPEGDNDVSKKKIIELYNYLSKISNEFFEEETRTKITTLHDIANTVNYDDLNDFKANYSDSQNFKYVTVASSGNVGFMVVVHVKLKSSKSTSDYPTFINVTVNGKTEIEVDEFLQEIKDFVVALFSSLEKEVTTANTSNTQPTDKNDQSFWVRHKPKLDFVVAILAVIVSLITIFGAMKSCGNNTADNEITKNQTFYSQQNEITSVTDTTTLLS